MLIPIILTLGLIIVYVIVSLNRPFNFRIKEYPNKLLPFVLERQNRVFKYWTKDLYQCYGGAIKHDPDGTLSGRTLQEIKDRLDMYGEYLYRSKSDKSKLHKVEFRIIED